MPRPRKLLPILRVELMSTGREYRPAQFIDDFTGQAMPVVQEDRPVRKLADAHELSLAAQRSRLERKRALLSSVMARIEHKAMVAKLQVPVHPTAKAGIPKWRRW